MTVFSDRTKCTLLRRKIVPQQYSPGGTVTVPPPEAAHKSQVESPARKTFAADSGGLSVPELAEKLCVSESSLYKKCMEFLNRSPGQLLTEHRLQNARQYLLSGSYPLREIAKLAGYSNEFSFSKAFTACFGISPSQYRKKR